MAKENSTFKNYRRQLNKIAEDWFAKKYSIGEVSEKYPFILKNRDDWKKNILSDLVATDIEKQKTDAATANKPFPLHKYFHHGLSSQAMLFNLIGEAKLKKDIELLKQIFPFDDVSIDSDSEIHFEYSNREIFKENQSQPTSFDLAIINSSCDLYEQVAVNKKIKKAKSTSLKS